MGQGYAHVGYTARFLITGIVTEEQEGRIRERCAVIPPLETNPLIFVDTNNIVHDPVADLAAYNLRMDLSWSEHEKDVFKRNLQIFDKASYIYLFHLLFASFFAQSTS